MLPAIRHSKGPNPLADRQRGGSPRKELHPRSSSSLEWSRQALGATKGNAMRHAAVGGGMPRSHSVDLGMFELSANSDTGQTWDVVDQLCNLETFVRGALSYPDRNRAGGLHEDARPQRRFRAIRSTDNARGSLSPSSIRHDAGRMSPSEASPWLSPLTKPAVSNRNEDAFAQKNPGKAAERQDAGARPNHGNREEEIEHLAAMTTCLPSPLGAQRSAAAQRPTVTAATGEHNSTGDPRRRVASMRPNVHSPKAAAPLSSSRLRSPCPDAGAKTLRPLQSGPARLIARASSLSPLRDQDSPDHGESMGLQAIPVFSLTTTLAQSVAAPRAARTGKI